MFDKRKSIFSLVCVCLEVLIPLGFVLFLRTRGDEAGILALTPLSIIALILFGLDCKLFLISVTDAVQMFKIYLKERGE